MNLLYVTYYDLTSKRVIESHTIESLMDPDPGRAYLITEHLVSYPAYVGPGGAVLPLPEAPGPEYVWDPITYAWIGDISATAWAREELMELQAAYFLERGFRITFRGDLHRFPCTVRNSERIRDAAMLAAQTAPSAPFSFHIESSTTAFSVTRSEALALHQELCTHSNAVDQERMRIVDAIVAAFALSETDLPGGLAAMMAIIWTYAP